MKNAPKTLSHRGYLGSIDVSLDDNCLFGKVLHIDGLLSYSGETVEELLSSFVAVVDEYLADCGQSGVEPQRPCSGVFQVRIDPDLHRDAQRLASHRGESLNQLVARAVCSFVGDNRASQGKTARPPSRNVVVHTTAIRVTAQNELHGLSESDGPTDDLYTLGDRAIEMSIRMH